MTIYITGMERVTLEREMGEDEDEGKNIKRNASRGNERVPPFANGRQSRPQPRDPLLNRWAFPPVLLLPTSTFQPEHLHFLAFRQKKCGVKTKLSSFERGGPLMTVPRMDRLMLWARPFMNARRLPPRQHV